MGRAFWAKSGVVLSGIVALCGVIWYAAPLFAMAGYYPFESPWIRGISIVFCAVMGGGYLIHYAYTRIKSAENLSEAVGQAEEQDDSDALKERMKDALTTLKSASGGKGDFLYDLPWYVIIGPPGSGKTTALVNSGLNFPLARGKTPQAIAGVGGTRYCDWWFTEDAVLIDTAGRYTTQDSNQRSDQKSWGAFLDLLKKNRPKQPINGVIVAISIQDLITLDQAELVAHAGAVRSRLLELHERLKIDFPVYVLFTKMDLVAGFQEYFGYLGEAGRRQVWGATFQTKSKTENMVTQFPGELDALVERLSEMMPDRLQGEPDPAARVRVFGFPAQVVTLKQPVFDFLTRIFEPTRYHSNAILRGFYFTSGTQEGTPIDRIIGSISRSFGAEAINDGYLSGTGKSYFLADLINKVIIGESAWVSTDQRAVRRNLLIKIAAYSALALATMAGVAAWTLSYTRNDQLIVGTNGEITAYGANAKALLSETTISDRKFERVLPLLEAVRNMPVGYEHRNEAVPTEETFGLSQRDRLRSAAETTYRAALERFLRQRLIFRLEEVLNAGRAEMVRSVRGDLYETFKVYLMLGAQGPAEKALIVDWARADWLNQLYPGPEKAGMRQALEEHLVAMLELDNGTGANVQLDGTLVKDVQEALVRMNLADRAYQMLKSKARSKTIKDWIAAKAGPNMPAVFTSGDGKGLDAVRVAGFYTYNGFHEGLIDRLPDIADQLERERWVLGEPGRQAVVDNQFQTLPDDILIIYAKDFIAAWNAALANIRVRPLTADRPKYLTLGTLSSAASPLKQLFEDIKTQTQLSRERKKEEAPAGAGAGAAKPAIVFQNSASAGRSIEDNFRPYYAWVEGNAGGREIDAFVGILNEVYQGLAGSAGEVGSALQLNAATRQSLATMRASSNRLPAPFDKLMRAASEEFEGTVASSVVAELQKGLAENVTAVCRQLITGRYPFTKGSDKEVQMADFARVFSPNGVMDKFFITSLQTYVDTSKAEWTWRKDSRVGQMLSNNSLREFQRAAQIRDAFFGAGGTQASFAFAVMPLTPTAAGTTVKLDINGTQIASPQAPPEPGFTFPGTTPPPAPPPQSVAPATVMFPGPTGLGRVTMVAISDQTGTSFPLMERTGVWALFKVLDQSKVSKQGDALRVVITAGREHAYRFNVQSTVNPFTMSALREFNCPATLVQ
ncbi:MAG: type VI secretion system membrane subunit TssM [Hyphomicrobiaceae bacterium]|nr:type VI secretion system membrane subunit TssM [Hyphomicrobiaceae bacterium]